MVAGAVRVAQLIDAEKALLGAKGKRLTYRVTGRAEPGA